MPPQQQQDVITIVSGLPRSGTSVMMQMLVNGGMPVVTDHIREADIDNPKGYYEYERVKRIKDDVSWLPETRGKAFKMVSLLLLQLPPTETYRIVFMTRDLQEMIASQERMLARRGEDPGPRDGMRRAYGVHLAKVRKWLAAQTTVAVLYVNYGDLLADPAAQAAAVNVFLGGHLDEVAMSASVDPLLYRNRSS